ncbi:MAG: ammonium transporter [Caldilineaceae bacterium]|nr:ammonium transporter [Caldilineaceae bacterium]MBP8106765.1 ammonium transporter [Caldilineaceae bacterium]MBP8121007.1 ammonium transporter [Caldilineaceae bacterium]MBP9071778.1 ammonium transporter [Caldilineaceae bacterium]
MEQLSANVDALATAMNILWVLLAAFLVFFMQAGFALVETGFTRAKNVAHTMMMNMMVFCIGALGFWICGFAFEFGAVNHTYAATAISAGQSSPEWGFGPITLGAWGDILNTGLRFGDQWGIIGLSGFFLQGVELSMAGLFAFFIFQMVFMDTAATIPTGSGAERMKFTGFILMGLWVSMVIYPLLGNWVWGGGWLANLGRTLGLGNGAVDFAGSGVVHTTGGAIGLALAIVIGPRLGRFNQDGTANAIPGHNIPMGILGTIILFFGWFGFNPGSALGIQGGLINLVALAAVNTLLAGAAGGMTAMLYMWLLGNAKKPDPSMSVNGVLAGLVAVTAPCAFIAPWAAVVIGLIAGVLVCIATIVLEKAQIDDPVGAVPVHMVNGLWGVISVGLFASGNPDTAAWNGIDKAVTGLFYGGGFGQLGAQLIEAGTIFIFAAGLSWLFFVVLNRFGLLRSEPRAEIVGLDIPEMGARGYWEGAHPNIRTML